MIKDDYIYRLVFSMTECFNGSPNGHEFNYYVITVDESEGYTAEEYNDHLKDFHKEFQN